MLAPEMIGVLIVLVGMGALAVVLVLLPAVQAQRRGYNPIVWGLAAIFSVNPLFIIVVLAMVPHRSRIRLREEFRKDLDRKLAAAGVGSEEDRRGPVRVDTHSVGDELTQMPQRSIGDDLTRM